MRPHILFLDGETPVREMLCLYLRKQDYQVSTAMTLAEGASLFEKGEFDLVILDASLAGEEVLQLLERIKKERPTLPVVMLTGLGCRPDLLKRAMELGANGFMAKTESLAILHAAVQKLLSTA